MTQKRAVMWSVLLASVMCSSGAFAQSKIVAASDVGYQPFSSANPAGGFQGIDIDIAEALSKQMGVKGSQPR